MKPEILAIIPARGGSKSLPRKNIRPLNGKPLIYYTIKEAMAAKLLDRIMVSTEDKEIAEIAKGYGVEVITRPANLAKDDTPSLPVFQHAIRYLEEIESYSPEIIVILQPTSPLRTAGDIDGAISKFLQTDSDAVVSVCKTEHPPHWTYTLEGDTLKPVTRDGEKITRRQDAPDAYRLNGAVYVTYKDIIMKQNRVMGDDTRAFIMPAERSVDIDTEIDFQLAEILMGGDVISAGRPARKINIAGRLIGKGEICFIIAEAGVNHNGDISLARKLIDAAKEAGVDAVKFQTFTAGRVVTGGAEKAEYQKETTGTHESQFEMLKNLELSQKDFGELFDYARKKGIIFLSTPFDRESVDFLEGLGVPAFKVASGEITNSPLLKHIAQKGKPIILSTGMATLEEVAEALEVIKKEGLDDIVLLHCITSYPAQTQDMNLKAMATLANAFRLPVGLSDHSTGITVPAAAVALGACIIEKHLTLDKGLPSPDHSASLEPGELKQMVKAIRDVEKAMGNGVKRPTRDEEANKKVGRRSIVAKIDIPRGTTITGEMLAIKRPGTGLEPKFLDMVIGKRVKVNINMDDLITWDKISAS